ncbi:30S ribosomal protein S1, partial [Enterobacter hormaechei]
MTESFAQLFEESLKEIETRPGSIVRGVVVAIDKDVVLVDAGLKSESAIPAEQFKNAQGELEIQVGDEVDVALDAVEDGFGETLLSREKAKRHEAWITLEKAYEEAETVVGVINGKVKGGFTVELNGIRAFLPGSLVDVRPVRDTLHLEGKELEFKVIKLDQKRNNVVVSRRAVIESENSAERDQLLENLQEGMEVKGIVKNLTDYGAFVDLGGVDGLLHITDMAWKRVKHPSEIVNVGDEITVKVLKFDRERTRVSLGLKQLGEDPWVAIAKRYPEGTKLTGRVTNLTDYGCFVEIEEGVEGLVHVSEMDWTNKNIHPSKVVNVGDVVEVMVLDIDEERRRISLGLKQCKNNPWQQFAETHNKGDRVEGKIKSITDFGIFIGLDGGIDGLVHLSDISWNVAGEEAVREYKKGDEIAAVVLQVDAERERISLGVKQLAEDPFNNWVALNKKGAIVNGKVTAVDAKGATVELADGVEGYLRASEASRDRVEDATLVLSVGCVLYKSPSPRESGLHRVCRLVLGNRRGAGVGWGGRPAGGTGGSGAVAYCHLRGQERA